ncbi:MULTISPECIES: fimbrial protein [Providencia]|uniref:Fimbrial protein n=1 Tax=Providencia rettgeri TaxID=587 RepID=A0A427HBA1_PRORE|nr:MULTISPECIES: fimbrial protein [Providencia]ELR5075909.1 fimbrial protein [Providencia stuartii]ELR5071572.1 fimbrial protein [Providencia rettgeri]ELR5219757.1 fimbrial protein [Providencia rettgeri]ELR5223918.1 fimbrial protein [Providencia rettgeri]MBV2188805.1 fimbrial protein [Providencia rettgeri]
MQKLNLTKMKIKQQLWQGGVFFLLLMSGTAAYAGVTCRPNSSTPGTGNPWNPLPEVYIDMNTTPGVVAPGTLLGSASSGWFVWACVFSGSKAERTIWFNNQTSTNTKNLLKNSGIRLYQDSMYGKSVEITADNTPSLEVGSWEAGAKSVVFGYTYRVIRGTGELKSFDTGVFNVGYHSDYQRRNFGDMYQARIIGKLVNYCPTPIVRMSNKVVDFKELTVESFENGKTVKENFSLDLVPDSTCEAALEISVAFQSNSGVVNKKYMLFNNGLQATITDRTSNQQVMFDQYYYKGSISKQKPGYFPYSVELSKKDDEAIKSGQFSNTVNVLFTYR